MVERFLYEEIKDVLYDYEHGMMACNIHLYFFNDLTYSQIYTRLQTLVRRGCLHKTQFGIYTLEEKTREYIKKNGKHSEQSL